MDIRKMVRFSRIVDIFNYYNIYIKGKENKVILNKRVLTGICLAVASSIASADIIGFDFTGRLVVAGPDGSIISNAVDGNSSTYTPIEASLTYDTVTGFGSSALSITMDGADFLGAPATFHGITLDHIEGTNLINGNVLVDWNGNIDMSLHIEWDATGLFNAINIGLEVGDTISGSTLIKASPPLLLDLDGELEGIVAPLETYDVGSATPYSDLLQLDPNNLQGPAPLAATSNSLGLGAETPFEGVRGYFDIGSGNSLHVTSVSTVPVPAAVWLFGSGLLTLVGFARRKV